MNLEQRLKLAQLPKIQQLMLLEKLANIKHLLEKEGIECKYDEVEEFSNGIAKVKLNGKWGFINKNGIEFWED